MTTNTKISVL